MRVNRVQHFGYCAQHNVNDGVDDGKAENAFFEMPENTILELQQCNDEYRNTDDVDFYQAYVRHSRNLNLDLKYNYLKAFRMKTL